MAWTYDPTDLDTGTASGRLNVVRYLIGDTNTVDQQVQDEEINFALSEEGDNVYSAAAYVAETIAAKYARLVTTELDGQLSMDYSDLVSNYKSIASEMKSKADSKKATLGVAGKTSDPAFERGQFDNTYGVDELCYPLS